MEEAQRYQVIQDDKDFIISTRLIGDKVRIECQDNNYESSPIYSRDYTLLELTSFSEIFNFTPSVAEVQNELNNAIERQEVKITNEGEYIEIVFNVKVNAYSQELTFQLPMKQTLAPTYYHNQGTTTAAPISNPLSVKHPIYKNTYNVNQNIGQEDYPDVTYSTKPNHPQIYQTPQNDIGCGCLLDHDRINKIEGNSQILRVEHDDIRKRINDLKMLIQMIKKETSDLRAENGGLNMKTLDLKKQYNNLIEAEAALRGENDDLRREKHELILKKNELGFYINEHHDHDTVREVNIPLDDKRRRPTNVSKREKQFGGGYSSNTYKQEREPGYSSNNYKQDREPGYSSNNYKQTGEVGYSSAKYGN